MSLMKTYIQDPKATFQKQWTTAYVPALYGEKSKKKVVASILGEMNRVGTLKFNFLMCAFYYDNCSFR